MKKQILLTLLTSMLCLSGFHPASASQPSGSCGGGTEWLPAGSNAVALDGNLQGIDAPDGWSYVGFDAAGRIAGVSDITCSCTCTSGEGGSCTASIFQGDCNCTADKNCKACDLTVSSFSPAEPNEIGQPLSEGGYIHEEGGVRLVNEIEAGAPSAFKAMFELPAVHEGVATFLDELYQGDLPPQPSSEGEGFQAPEGYYLAPVSVFGRSAFVVVSGQLAAEIGELEDLSKAGSCSCTEGTCTYASKVVPFKGTLHYCEGVCTGTCSLSL